MTQLYELKTKGLEFIGDIPAEHINDIEYYRQMKKSSTYRGGKCAVIIFENYNYVCYKHTYYPTTNKISYNKDDKYICDQYFKQEDE